MSILKTFLLFIALVSLVNAQEDPVAYINEAIDKLEKNWEKRDTVDWQDIRSRYSEQASDVKTVEDTYPIIRALLRELGDSWNYLSVPGETYEVPRDQTGFRVMLPDWVLVYVFDESPAAKAGMKVGDQIIAVNGKPVTSRDAWDAPFQPDAGAIYSTCENTPAQYCDLLREIYTPGVRLQLKSVGQDKSFIVHVEGQVENNLMVPVGKRFGDVGYIELPPLKVGPQEYIDIVQQAIKDIDQTPTCGWIVDLRRHAGGDGPFFEAVIPLFAKPNETFLKNPQSPMAVLLSPLTYSMGEITANSLIDFSNAEAFGENSGGNHPSFTPFRLMDKAILGVTTFSEVIVPDVEIKNDWRYFQTEDDPVIQAAIEWLMQQETCNSE